MRAKITAVAMAFGLAFGGAVQADTLADALTGAYKHSGLLEQNRALLRAADENVAVALSALRPIVNWSADVVHSASRNATAASGFVANSASGTTASLGISAQLVVYDFGKSRIAVDIAKESVLATRHRLINIEQSILLRAVTAFMEVRRTSEFLALRQNNVRLITQELRAARDRFEVGEVTRTDVSLAEARLAAARSGLAAAQGDLARAQLEYAAAVGYRPKNVSPPRSLPAIPASLEAATATALRNHPSILAGQKDVTVSELNVAAADAALLPTATLSGRIGVGENLGDAGYSRSGSVTLGIQGPISAGGRLSALQRQAMQRRDASRAALHVTSHEVRQNVGNAYASVLVARASRQSGEEQVRASRVAFRGVREETSLGARTTLDVLNAEQELLQAQATLISAQVDEYVGAYRLLAAMGRLTAKDLGLGVQIFDPAAYYNMVKDAPMGQSEQGKKLDRVLRRIGNN